MKPIPMELLPTEPIGLEESVAAQRAYIAAMRERADQAEVAESEAALLTAHARVLEIELHNTLFNHRLMIEAEQQRRRSATGVIIPRLGDLLPPQSAPSRRQPG